ncbi:MAG: CDP-alcohol phosphatidyltransferase family protein [Chloroflexi bacterium]|nr:CDP-alcohol phosphatidyltransferase family protein [Chloroflexota bacterium]
MRWVLPRYWPKHWFLPLALALGRVGLTPNALTLIGLGLSGAGAALLALGHFFLGGVMVLVSGVFDSLDGQLARATQQSSAFGALLDSTLDRVSEAVLLFGLLVYYSGHQAQTEVLLINATLVGSVMVSYVKARAEGLGLRCDVGWFQRPERVVLLAVGLLANYPTGGWATPVVLWLLAVLTNVTAAQRVWHVWRHTHHDQPPGGR